MESWHLYSDFIYYYKLFSLKILYNAILCWFFEGCTFRIALNQLPSISSISITCFFVQINSHIYPTCSFGHISSHILLSQYLLACSLIPFSCMQGLPSSFSSTLQTWRFLKLCFLMRYESDWGWDMSQTGGEIWVRLGWDSSRLVFTFKIVAGGLIDLFVYWRRSNRNFVLTTVTVARTICVTANTALIANARLTVTMWVYVSDMRLFT